VLVDGVDEVPREQRTEVRRWLERLIRNYPDARYVVTTRPSAVDEQWLAEGLLRYELLPLSRQGMRT
jgi:predicted NACHT family NTPase